MTRLLIDEAERDGGERARVAIQQENLAAVERVSAHNGDSEVKGVAVVAGVVVPRERQVCVAALKLAAVVLFEVPVIAPVLVFSVAHAGSAPVVTA